MGRLEGEVDAVGGGDASQGREASRVVGGWLYSVDPDGRGGKIGGWRRRLRPARKWDRQRQCWRHELGSPERGVDGQSGAWGCRRRMQGGRPTVRNQI